MLASVPMKQLVIGLGILGLLAGLTLAFRAERGEDMPEDGTLGHLPAPVSNNAVALTDGPDGAMIYSFLGLGAGKTHTDITRAAYAVNLATGDSRTLPPVPVPQGTLAATAITVNGLIYVIGGYTVAPDGAEISTPHVHVFDPATATYERRADMPLPVDDTVAGVYRDRYIYLVSGWHDTGNVADVQVYDTQEDRWFAATEYPGAPVFGHAGGLVDGCLVIADGVAVLGEQDGRRQFGLVDEAWLGCIDPDDPARIDWQEIEPHPGPPLYRIAAMGDAARGKVIFAGGSTNAYNYNGMGYDGNPSLPSDAVFAYDVRAREWITYPDKPVPTMDHRGLIRWGNLYVIAGGMVTGQQVTDRVTAFRLPGSD